MQEIIAAKSGKYMRTIRVVVINAIFPDLWFENEIAAGVENPRPPRYRTFIAYALPGLLAQEGDSRIGGSEVDSASERDIEDDDREPDEEEGEEANDEGSGEEGEEINAMDIDED